MDQARAKEDMLVKERQNALAALDANQQQHREVVLTRADTGVVVLNNFQALLEMEGAMQATQDQIRQLSREVEEASEERDRLGSQLRAVEAQVRSRLQLR